MQDLFSVFSGISSAEQWRTIELPVNKTVQASILEIVNPHLFYALPNEMPGKKPKFESYSYLLNCIMKTLTWIPYEVRKRRGGW